MFTPSVKNRTAVRSSPIRGDDVVRAGRERRVVLGARQIVIPVGEELGARVPVAEQVELHDHVGLLDDPGSRGVDGVRKPLEGGRGVDEAEVFDPSNCRYQPVVRSRGM